MNQFPNLFTILKREVFLGASFFVLGGKKEAEIDRY